MQSFIIVDINCNGSLIKYGGCRLGNNVHAHFQHTGQADGPPSYAQKVIYYGIQ